MSYKAICEIILYIESFKNIQLIDQGIYYIKTYIQKVRNNGEIIHASLNLNLQVNKQLRSRKKNKIKQQAEILDTEYKTKSFRIRYNQQQIDLQEVVVFRIQFDAYPDLDVENVYIYFDLYYSTEYFFTEFNQLNFKQLTSMKAKLNNIEMGICNFSNLAFENKYKSSINIYALSIILDYKVRLFKSLSAQKSQFEIERQKVENLEQYYQLFFVKQNKSPAQFYQTFVKKYRTFSDSAKKNWVNILNKKMEIEYKLPKYVLQPQNANKEYVTVPQKDYITYLNNYKLPEFNLMRIQQQLQYICINNYGIYQLILKQIENNNIDKQLLKIDYLNLMKERCGQFIFKAVLKSEDLINQKYSGKQKKSIAKKIRKKQYYNQLELHNIEDLNFFPKLKEQPILFHQIIELNQPVNTRSFKNTLFVFSHGFQGSSYDMVEIKNTIKMFYPKANFLLARSNEGKTQGDISKMGEKLAQEIKQFIRDEEIQENLIIHMIGHSLGGLILRASLRKLEKFANNFGTFLTFSSPHLGYLNGTKTSIEAGLWFMKKWKEILSLQQMAMSDSQKIQQTLIYKLSQNGHLKNFRNIFLISSYEDSYVPWHSARIHSFKQSTSSKRVFFEDKMIRNILGNQQQKNIKIEKIHRIDVSFQIPQNNIDSMIGRTAHIKFLQDQIPLKMMLFCTPNIFS